LAEDRVGEKLQGCGVIILGGETLQKNKEIL